MSKIRMIAMASATVAAAAGIGTFVQKGETAQTAQGPEPQVAQMALIAPIAVPVVDVDPPLDVQAIILTSAMPDTEPPARLTAPQPDLADGPAPALAQPEVSSLACAVTASAMPAPMASVDLTVVAPCFGNHRVTVHHNGMMFTDATNADGILSVTVPALSENAVFVVAFANGKGAVAMTQVPDMADIDRVVLQWSGQNSFQIHAREFGADYGGEGHVWFGMPDRDTDHLHGSIIRLGDVAALVPQIAEIYTFPTHLSDVAGIISMSIEAEVTADNCGHDMEAQTLEINSGSQLRTREIVLSVPDCNAIGDFLVLNNLVDDMKIASN